MYTWCPANINLSAVIFAQNNHLCFNSVKFWQTTDVSQFEPQSCLKQWRIGWLSRVFISFPFGSAQEMPFRSSATSARRWSKMTAPRRSSSSTAPSTYRTCARRRCWSNPMVSLQLWLSPPRFPLLFIPNNTVPAVEKPERFQSSLVDGWGHGPRSKWLVFGEQIWIYEHIRRQSSQRYFGADTDLDLGISLAEVQALKVSYNPWSDREAELVKIYSRGCKYPARVSQKHQSSCLSAGERWLSGNRRRRLEATRPASNKLDFIAIPMRVGIN